MAKIQFSIKAPDAISDIINAHVPNEDTPACEKKREAFHDKFFQWGDYLKIEIDTKTLTGKVLPLSKWRGC